MDKYYTRHAVKVRTISKEMAAYMSDTRKLPLDHYLVLDNWQNEDDFESFPKRKPDGHLVFAYVGSINVHSNVELIIRAFDKAAIPNSKLRIFGGGNRKEQCVQLAKELGADNISFGLVSRDKVPEVQSEADILVLALPSGNGGLCLPSKMTSYMLSGKPILASIDADSATERYINEAKCGIAVNPDNLDSLKKGFEMFGNMSSDEIVRMGHNSKVFADNHLTRKANLPTSFRPVGMMGKGEFRLPPLDEAGKYYQHLLNCGFDAVNSRGNSRAEFQIMGRIRLAVRLFFVRALGLNYVKKFKQKDINKYLFVPEDSWENVFPTIMPNWDRSPRSGKEAVVYTGSTRFQKN